MRKFTRSIFLNDINTALCAHQMNKTTAFASTHGITLVFRYHNDAHKHVFHYHYHYYDTHFHDVE
jgi:hypothetical protein